MNEKFSDLSQDKLETMVEATFDQNLTKIISKIEIKRKKQWCVLNNTLWTKKHYNRLDSICMYSWRKCYRSIFTNFKKQGSFLC
mgnify:CR=1 FL=1